MSVAKHEILPGSLAPVGINREQAAALIGVSVSLFDRAVAENRMPSPRMLYGRLVWDVQEITSAFRSLPHRSEPVDGEHAGSNPWD